MKSNRLCSSGGRVFLAAAMMSVATWSAPRANAVIVAGALGGGNTTNNTTGTQLNTWAQAQGLPEFSYFSNIVRYADASAVYLGYDSVTKDVWVLTAKHVNDVTTAITIQGVQYTWEQRINIANMDLRLVRYSHPDNLVPSLPAVVIGDTSPTVGAQIVMIGYGKNRVQDASTGANSSDDIVLVGPPSNIRGYTWAAGNNFLRWGTNDVSTGVTTHTSPVTTQGFEAAFNRPGTGQWLTSTEAIGTLGDSGGGAFFYNGSEWVLAGIFSSATAIDVGGGVLGSPFTSGKTVFADVATSEGTIQSTIGSNVIPEPSTALLALLAAGLLTVHRRIRSQSRSR